MGLPPRCPYPAENLLAAQKMKTRRKNWPKMILTCRLELKFSPRRKGASRPVRLPAKRGKSQERKVWTEKGRREGMESNL
jgi:hypothetical protein